MLYIVFDCIVFYFISFLCNILYCFLLNCAIFYSIEKKSCKARIHSALIALDCIICIVFYCIVILNCIIMYYIFCMVLYFMVFDCTALSNFIMYCFNIALHCIWLYCILFDCFVFIVCYCIIWIFFVLYWAIFYSIE